MPSIFLCHMCRFTLAGSATAGTATPSRASADSEYNDQLMSLDSFGQQSPSFDLDADDHDADHDRTYTDSDDDKDFAASVDDRDLKRRQAGAFNFAGKAKAAALAGVPVMVATDLAARGLDFAGAQVCGASVVCNTWLLAAVWCA